MLKGLVEIYAISRLRDRVGFHVTLLAVLLSSILSMILSVGHLAVLVK